MGQGERGPQLQCLGRRLAQLAFAPYRRARLSAGGWARRLSVGSIISTYRAVKVFSMGRLGCEARPTFGNDLSQPTCGCPKCLDLAPEVLGFSPKSTWTLNPYAFRLEPVRFPAVTRTLYSCNPYAFRPQPVGIHAGMHVCPRGNTCVSTWEHVCIHVGKTNSFCGKTAHMS